MKTETARIVLILDRSGSMQSVRESTVSGFNDFIRAQRQTPGEVVVTLVQFDNLIEEVFTLPLKDVPELNQNNFVPRGGTALLDAQGMTIVGIGKELAELPEAERPSRVIFVTLTDGEENSSKQYTMAKIAALIKQQRDVYGWDFVFLGANQDAISTAAAMNIPAGSALTYRASAGGTESTFASAANRVRSSRQRAETDFTDEQRRGAMDGAKT